MPERTQILQMLQDHQRKVADLLNEAERGLRSPGDDRARTMAAIRWRLMRVLRDYQLFKHRTIFDPIIAGDDPSRRAKAAAMKARCIDAGDLYERHVRKWSLDGIGDWNGYHADKAGIIEMIGKHLDREAGEARALLT